MVTIVLLGLLMVCLLILIVRWDWHERDRYRNGLDDDWKGSAGE